VRSLTSHNPIGLQGLLRDSFTYIINDRVKEDETGRIYSTNAKKRNTYRILVRGPAGKRSLGRLRRGLDNFKMELRPNGIDWIYLVQDRDR
jgi:hypothetical protein